MLEIITLGAAAGGGLPQWNCHCDGCKAAWDQPALHHGQVSLAVSADGGAHWFLINASPDIRAQILHTPALRPKAGHLRHSPIAGVILTNAEIDAVAGLLSLREGQKFALHAHPAVLQTLQDNSIFNVLNPDNVPRLPITMGETFEPALPDGSGSGLEVTAFSLPGKCAWYQEGPSYQAAQGQAAEEGDTIGLTLRAKGQTACVHVVLACAEITPELRERLRGADMVFFEGTLWRDDEMITQGLSQKTGQRMGHVSISGADGTMAQLEGLDIRRKVFVHINNSNPIWQYDSPERAEATAAGWEVPQAAEVFKL